MRLRHQALVSLAIAMAVDACAPRETERVELAKPASGPRIVVQASLVADSKIVAATVQTRDQADARARIGGALVSLAVREGDQVRRGQLIGRVVDQRLDFETNAMDAQVAQAAALSARAQAELKRAAYLYDNGVYAKARLEQVEAEAKAAQGALAAAQAQRGASAELAGQGAVRAPASGRVLRADTPAGSVLGPGQSIATITAGPPVLRLEVPEADGRTLKVGDTLAILPEDLPGATHGTISQVYPAITAGRITADLTVPGLRTELVGQRVRVRLDVGQRRAVVVPKTYVAHRYGLDFVRVLDASGRPSDVAVQLSPAPDSAKVEILSGVSGGDILVPPGA